MLAGDNRVFERISLRNEQKWKLISEKEELELFEFHKVELQVLDFDEEYSSVIDLPSIAFESGQELSIIDQSTPKAQKTKLIYDEDQNSNSIDESVLQEYSDVKSNLVKKLFPSKIAKADTSSKQEIDQLRSRITEIELENSKSKQLYAKIKREKEELERKFKILQDEKVLETNQEKQSATLQKEHFKLQSEHESNMKRLKREKLQWEKQRRLSEILPTKRERQEIELLQTKLQEQLVQFKQKENRQQMTNDRLSRKIMDLEKRNREMGDEIKIFEKERASFLELKKNYQAILEKSDTNTMRKSKSMEIKPNLSFSQIKVPLEAIRGKPTVLSSKELIGKKYVESKKSKDHESLKNDNQSSTLTWCDEIKPEPPNAKADLDKLEKHLGLTNQKYTVLKINKAISNKDYWGRKYDTSTHFWYESGNLRVLQNGDDVTYYTNGDSKTVYEDGRELYYFNETKTKHTTYKDGTEMIEFESGQIEKRYLDGKRVIYFPDKIVRTIYPNGREELVFPDGKYSESFEGKKNIFHVDGTKEVWSNGVKSKLYPTGIVKRIFQDGSQETRWPNGQLRGNVVKFVKPDEEDHTDF